MVFNCVVSCVLESHLIWYIIYNKKTPSIERTTSFFIIAGSDELFLHGHDLYDFIEHGYKNKCKCKP